MESKYKIEKYNATKGFLIVIIIFVSFFTLVMIIARRIHSPLLAPIVYVLMMSSFLIFAKKVRAIFTRRIMLEFDVVNFSIIWYHAKTEEMMKQIHIPWREIKSYKVYFSPAKNTIITLYLRNGTFRRWNFKDNKTFEEALKSESLFKTFFSYVKQYNVGKEGDAKIALNKGFFNSNAGTTVIYVEIALVVVGFIVHVILHPPSSIFTLLMGGSLTVQQYFQRKEEQKTYDRISALE